MSQFRMRVCYLVVWLAVGCPVYGDVLQVGNRFPSIAFSGADGSTESFEEHMGKRSIVFVFASW